MCIRDRLIAERKQEEEANNSNLVKEELKTAGEEINELKESKLQLVEEKEPVSYTHLDVYKRQISSIAASATISPTSIWHTLRYSSAVAFSVVVFASASVFSSSV